MNKLVILLAGALFLSAACQPRIPAATETTETAGFIRVSGKDLVTPAGEKFFIRGTNLGNWLNPEGYMFGFSNASSYGRINQALCELVGPRFMEEFWRAFKDNYIVEQDIAFIARTGANTIRIPFHYKLFTDEDYMGLYRDQDGFERLDTLVEWCRRHELKLILDMHDCPGGQTGDNIDDSYGYPWLFENEADQQQFIDIGVRIAEHYRDEPVILGYDLMNEPIAHYFDTAVLNPRLEPLLIRTTQAIRQVDRNHIVMLAGAQWNGTFDRFTDWTFDDNIMYTCHQYWSDPTADAIRPKIDFRDRSALAMFMGETGENTDEWCRDFRVVLEENNIGWTYWTYKRLNAGACFVSIPAPEGWDEIVSFTQADRSSFSAIREARPSQENARRALLQLLENCKYENVLPNPGYIGALGLDATAPTNPEGVTPR
jgi:hypothetical protein